MRSMYGWHQREREREREKGGETLRVRRESNSRRCVYHECDDANQVYSASSEAQFFYIANTILYDLFIHCASVTLV